MRSGLITHADKVLFSERGEPVAEDGDEGLFLFGDADDVRRVEPDHGLALLELLPHALYVALGGGSGFFGGLV